MNTLLFTILKIWAIWGFSNFLLTVAEVVWVMRPVLRKLGWTYFKKNMLPEFIRKLISICITFLFLGPISTIISIQFSKALSSYRVFMGKEVMSDLYGVGKTHKIDIGSGFSPKPKVWVKFHSYPDPILIAFSNLTIISNEDY